MSFTGQLHDLSLGELIEFFCNQRKTGRLKVDYALAPGVFFIKEGQLVDAKVGALNGVEAVFFALTLPSAAFDFSAGVVSSRHTITEPWASVVLEGLRRIDEGIKPNADAAFVGEDKMDEAFTAYLECMETGEGKKSNGQKKATGDAEPVMPLSMMVDATASEGQGGKRKMMVAGAAAAVVAICLAIAIPVTRSLRSKPAEALASAAAASTAPAEQQQPQPQPDADTSAAQTLAQPDAKAAKNESDEAAKREREASAREARQKARREEEARKAAEAARILSASTPTAPAQGAKSVRVSIAYDENGRVTQASAVGTSPGAEAYAATAVRVARSRRFPAGKAGSTVVTIPMN
ncbi:MAG: DUF4388 domain-containing protein [Pyrinomonadaceae bacterium]